MKVVVQEIKVEIEQLPEGTYFWHGGALFLKPVMADCIPKVKALARNLAIRLESNMLLAFADRAEVQPELKALTVVLDSE